MLAQASRGGRPLRLGRSLQAIKCQRRRSSVLQAHQDALLAVAEGRAPPDAEATAEAIQRVLAAGRADVLVDFARMASRGERSRAGEATDAAKFSVLLIEAAAEAGDAQAQFLLGTHHMVQLERESVADAAAQPPPPGPAGADGGGDADADTAAEAAAKRKKVLGEIRRTLRRNRKAQRSGAPDPRAAAIETAQEARRTARQEAERWLTASASAGHTPAMVALGNLVAAAAEEGDATAFAVARRWYERAAAAEPPHPDALYNLGTMLFEGMGGDADKRAAVAFFERAAEPLYWVGYMHHVGDEEAGVRPSPERSLAALRAAAQAGHGDAAYYLAQLYRSGTSFGDAGEAGADAGEFERWLRRAEELACADAVFARADMHFHGDGPVRRDLPRSAELYARAGALGHAPALVSLGAMHYHGMGVPQDFEAAFRCYERAGELGSRDGWVNVAAMYLEGKGVPRCEQTARHILGLVKAGKLGAADGDADQ